MPDKKILHLVHYGRDWREQSKLTENTLALLEESCKSMHTIVNFVGATGLTPEEIRFQEQIPGYSPSHDMVEHRDYNTVHVGTPQRLEVLENKSLELFGEERVMYNAMNDRHANMFRRRHNSGDLTKVEAELSRLLLARYQKRFNNEIQRTGFHICSDVTHVLAGEYREACVRNYGTMLKENFGLPGEFITQEDCVIR